MNEELMLKLLAEQRKTNELLQNIASRKEQSVYDKNEEFLSQGLKHKVLSLEKNQGQLLKLLKTLEVYSNGVEFATKLVTESWEPSTCEADANLE